jgi:two-component system NtrC family response regulator
VRELSNVIEHVTIVCNRLPITPDHLPQRFGTRKVRARPIGPMALRDLELQAIQESLDRHGGNKPAAAEELGVSLKTLYNKLNQVNPSEKAA